MQIRNILLVLAMLVFALSVSFFGQSASHVPITPSVASSTLEKVANPPSAASVASRPQTPVSTTGSSSAATTSAALPPKAKPLPAPKPQTTPTTTPRAPAASAGTTTAFDRLDTTVGLLQGTVVNILCTSNSDGFRSTSGTGIFIDSRGLILTAAHVVEFMLLTDYTNVNGSCVVRAGSPAENAYKVKLAYISPAWVRENSRVLVEKAPTGTGENDFAVLAVTGEIGTQAPPMPHPAVMLSKEVPSTLEKVSIGSYGAEFLSGDQIRNMLYPIIDFGTVKERFTFTTDTVDLLALGGSAAAQEGSSGGGVLNADNELIGLITTSSTEGTVEERDLRAITIDHIRRSFSDDLRESFDFYLAGHTPTQLIAIFDTEARTLAGVVLKALSH